MFNSFTSLIAGAFDEIEAKKKCDNWVKEGGSYLMWAKDWGKVDVALLLKWTIKGVSKRVC